jgi:hypothetical protein
VICSTNIARGQIVEYMLGYQVKYGFISNYNNSIFIRLSLDKFVPVVYISRIIKHTEIIDEGAGRVSLRFALF